MDSPRTNAFVVLTAILVVGTAGIATSGGILTVGASGPEMSTDSTQTHATGHPIPTAGQTLSAQAEPLFQTDIDADAVTMDVRLDSEGNASWRVVYRLTLEDEEAIKSFEDLAAEVKQNTSTYLAPFKERLRLTADTAQETTGREMSVRAFDVAATETVQPDTRFGEVTFSFRWDNFAAVTEDDQVEAGDALDGLVLDEQTSLTFRWGELGQLESHTPEATVVGDSRLTWRGPQEFNRGQPRAVFRATSGQTESTVETDSGEATTADDSTQEVPDDGTGTFSAAPVFVAGLAVALVVTGAVVILRGTPFSEEDPPEEHTSEENIDDTETSETEANELLSNEERILKLVDENGGRMKQKNVTETFDWSAARTSQVVSNLREEDRIETFRIGRENVLTLPDVDIAGDNDGDNNDGSSTATSN